MKRALAIISAMLFYMLAMAATPASAAVQNIIKANEETITAITSDAYPPSMAEWNGMQWGTWVQNANDKPVEDKWVSIDSTTKKFGSKSFKIDTKGQATNGCIIYPMNPSMLQKGSTYTLTGYIKTSNVAGGGGADLHVRFITTQNNTSIPNGEFYTDPLTGTNDWKRMNITFTVPNANFDQIQIQLRIWGNTKGVAWFDGISLTSGSTVPTDYEALTNPEDAAPTTTGTATPTTTPPGGTGGTPTVTPTPGGNVNNPATGTNYMSMAWLIPLALAAIAAIIGIIYAVKRADDHTDNDRYNRK